MARIAKQRITRHYDAAGKACRAADSVRKVTKRSRKWYAYDVPGSVRPIPLATNRRVAEQMFARLVAEGEGAAADLPRPKKARPVAELLPLFRAHLAASGDCAEHVKAKHRRVERAVAGLGWSMPRDLAAAKLERWLADEASLRDWSPRYRNEFLSEVGSFCRWLLREGELRSDPTAGISKWPEDVDLRRDRRPLTADELQLLLGTVRDATVDRWPHARARARMPARDRHMAYLVTVSTGFRAGEVASLTPAHLLLDDAPPVALLPARRDKRRQPVRQPLPPDVVPLLAAYCEGKPVGERLWPGQWWKRAGELLRDDLIAAGIPHVTEGPDGPLWVDFHSLRHTFGALLDRAGVTLKQAMQLMRHSDPRLTARRYGRASLEELGRAVEGLEIVTPIVTAAEAVTAGKGGKRHDGGDAQDAGGKRQKRARPGK